MKEITGVPKFELFGCHIFERPGLALPLFRSSNFLSNAIYLGETEVSGDLNSCVFDFDVTTLECHAYLENPIEIGSGDKWRSVFITDNSTFVGTPHEIFAQSEDEHADIRKLAPLSFLDLAVAVSSENCPTYYSEVRQLIESRFSSDDVQDAISETVLRKYVSIAIARCLRDSGAPVDLPSDLRNFEIVHETRKRLKVLFSADALLILDNEKREAFGRDVRETFSLLGLQVDLATEKFSDTIEPQEDNEGSATGAVGTRRSRRFGLVHEFAIDLGTTNTRIFSNSRGLILTQPSAVALRQEPGFFKIVAIGDEALAMEGRTPENINVVYPIREGVIADLDVASAMVKHFIALTGERPNLIRPLDVVLCVPAGSTPAERKAIAKAIKAAGAARVSIVLQPLMAALGAGSPVIDPVGTMVATIGGGATEVAIVALNGVAYSTSVRTGGDRMTDEVISYVRRYHNLHIGRATAERIKREYGVASPDFAVKNLKFRLRGRDLVQGVPAEVEMSQESLAEAFEDVVKSIVEAIRITLEGTAPELAADVVDQGIVLTGGGARLGSLDRLIEQETGLPVYLPDEPETCVAKGIGIAMSDPAFYSTLLEA